MKHLSTNCNTNTPKTIVVPVRLTPDMLIAIDCTAGPGGRSRFLREGAEMKLAALRLKEARAELAAAQQRIQAGEPFFTEDTQQ